MAKSRKGAVKAQGWKHKETLARRAIEDQGFIVHDANVLFHANCPNIDLVVFGSRGAIYVQVKSSSRPASKDGIVLHGKPWSEKQLFENAAIYNEHSDTLQAHLVIIVDNRSDGTTEFYLAPPKELERVLRRVGRAFAKKPKRDGTQRKMFWKEAPRSKLERWLGAWDQLSMVR